VFAQDEIALVPGRLFATLGAKYERNAFSGGELQPNVRSRVLLPRNQVLWGAVSRATRRPTRLDADPVVFGPTGTTLIVGTHDFESEKLVAYEAGYRVQPVPLFSVDATVFRHRYTDLRSQDLPPTGLPLVVGNSLAGSARGLELGANFQPLDRWRTHVSYTRLSTDVRRAPGSRDVTGGVGEANDPAYTFGIRTAIDLAANVDVDAWLRSIAELPNPRVPAYTELNLRVAWRLSRGVELSLSGQDLLHARHPEAGPPTSGRIEFERAVRAGLAVRY
jgi:iron complex outermembrane receptor protein